MTRTSTILKRVLPDREMNLPILCGPFRGGQFFSRPRSSLRKVFGLYEHELNGWLRSVLPRVDRIIDVGANDGYFTFGSAAALRRHGKSPHVIAVEPDPHHVWQLGKGREASGFSEAAINIVHAHAGRVPGNHVVALDQFPSDGPTLIKIDVEGAELDVINGGKDWLTPKNFFLIEVHCRDYLAIIRKMFSEVGLNILQINQQQLPVIGGERRDVENWWLVTDLSGSSPLLPASRLIATSSFL